MKKIVIATSNKGKISEIQSLLSDMSVEVLPLLDFTGIPEIREDGLTFFENAFIKARIVARHTGLPALADDSGIEVDALGGAPGVRSARYAGKDAKDIDNINKLLVEMKDIPKERRAARFRCVMVLHSPDERWISAEGACFGEISFEPKGEKGFGYDPVFFLPDRNKTMAEIEKEEKNSFSHRTMAIMGIKHRINDFLIDIKYNNINMKTNALENYEKNECLKMAVDITRAYAQSGENKHGQLTDVLEKTYEKLLEIKKKGKL
jgi:XTP/dITP diphosphohydrolase